MADEKDMLSLLLVALIERPRAPQPVEVQLLPRLPYTVERAAGPTARDVRIVFQPGNPLPASGIKRLVLDRNVVPPPAALFKELSNTSHSLIGIAVIQVNDSNAYGCTHLFSGVAKNKHW